MNERRWRLPGFFTVLALSIALSATTQASLVLKKVTFYPTSAALLWEGKVTPEKGVVTLGYLPASAVKDSVEVQLSSPLELLELRVQEVKEDPQLAKMKEEIKGLKVRLEGLKARRDFIRGLLNSPGDGKGQGWWGGLTLKETLARLQVLSDRLGTLSTKIEGVNQELAKKEKELERWLQGHRWKLVARVKGKGPGTVQLSYRVNKAQWKPLYSARLERERVHLQFMARLYQETGMDWQGVRVVLSTARPRGRVTPPTPTPLYLRPVKPIRILRAVPVATRNMGEETASPTPGETSYTLLEGVALYTPPGTLSLESGKGDLVKIKSWNLTPKVERFCYAVADPAVYITATLESLPQILPPGKMELYQGPSLVGETYLTFKAPLKLSFGRDQTLKVKRVQTRRFLDKKFGGKVEITVAYETTITNLGPRAKKVKVVERIPVSQDERIQVKFKGAQPPAEPDKEKGFLEWMVTVPPQGKSRVSYTFSVKYPEKLHLNHSF